MLKIGNLANNIEFFRNKLGMRVLRHESFDKGCEAACNGRYDSRWTKTMIGYGPENDNFVLELTFNYPISSYKQGNDLEYIKLRVDEQIYEKLKSDARLTLDGDLTVNSPDGYRFVVAKASNSEKPDVTEVCLTCSNINNSISYWRDLLQMKTVRENQEGNGQHIVLHYASNQASLRLKQIQASVEHEKAFGRIAFSCPSSELRSLQAQVEKANFKVLIPYVSLDTPGKATVEVVILADPDGHEICFVGDEGFRELSQIDSKADQLVEESIREIASLSDKIKTRPA